MSYACMAHVTDYDVWHETEEAVTVEAVIRMLMHNAEVAVAAVANAIELLAESGPSPYASTPGRVDNRQEGRSAGGRQPPGTNRRQVLRSIGKDILRIYHGCRNSCPVSS